jgi:hypothetical protein
VLSHRSAAALWRIVPRRPATVDVTVDETPARGDLRPPLPPRRRHHPPRHPTPQAFETDRDRGADLLNAGFSPLRITDDRLKRHQAKEAQRLRQILDLH